jgi:hypothetical protein
MPQVLQATRVCTFKRNISDTGFYSMYVFAQARHIVRMLIIILDVDRPQL